MSVIAPSTLASAGAPSRLTNPAIPHIVRVIGLGRLVGMAAFIVSSSVPEQGWPGKSSTLRGRAFSWSLGHWPPPPPFARRG